MVTVTTTVDIDAEDVLEELSDETLRKELRKRCINVHDPAQERALLEQIWLHYRDKPDVPQCLRDYMWSTLGKVL